MVQPEGRPWRTIDRYVPSRVEIVLPFGQVGDDDDNVGTPIAQIPPNHVYGSGHHPHVIGIQIWRAGQQTAVDVHPGQVPQDLKLVTWGAVQASDSLELDLSRPDLDFAELAKGMGVPAARATTADELVTALERGLTEPGPFLVDAVLPPRL